LAEEQSLAIRKGIGRKPFRHQFAEHFVRHFPPTGLQPCMPRSNPGAEQHGLGSGFPERYFKGGLVSESRGKVTNLRLRLKDRRSLARSLVNSRPSGAEFLRVPWRIQADEFQKLQALHNPRRPVSPPVLLPVPKHNSEKFQRGDRVGKRLVVLAIEQAHFRFRAKNPSRSPMFAKMIWRQVIIEDETCSVGNVANSILHIAE